MSAIVRAAKINYPIPGLGEQGRSRRHLHIAASSGNQSHLSLAGAGLTFPLKNYLQTVKTFKIHYSVPSLRFSTTLFVSNIYLPCSLLVVTDIKMSVRSRIRIAIFVLGDTSLTMDKFTTIGVLNGTFNNTEAMGTSASLVQLTTSGLTAVNMRRCRGRRCLTLGARLGAG